MSTNELKDRVNKLVGDGPATFHTVKQVALLVVKYMGEVSSDDVRFYVKTFEPSSAVIGTAFKSLADEGKIKHKTYKATDVKSSKGRPIAVYEAC